MERKKVTIRDLMKMKKSGRKITVVSLHDYPAAVFAEKAGIDVVLVGDVSLGTGNGTLYTSLGDILGWATLAGLVAFSIYQSINNRQTQKVTKG